MIDYINLIDNITIPIFIYKIVFQDQRYSTSAAHKIYNDTEILLSNAIKI